MFDYDKTIRKLTKFSDLEKKKQNKIIKSILIDSEFRSWFYGVGENSNSQPMTSPMINKLFNMLASPQVIKRVTKFIEDCDRETFDHTACSIAFLITEQAVDTINKINSEISTEYGNGELPSDEVKDYKGKSEKYTRLITDLLDAIRAKCKEEIKEIANKSNLPKGIVYTTYLMVPGREYIPKYKISLYMNQLLHEIYKWVGNSGIDDTVTIKWGPYFGSLFGNNLTASSSVSILLEGVKRIDAYRQTEHFDDVRVVWDSLTNFAVTELDTAPEHVRRHMLDIYMKRLEKICKNGNIPRLRVNLLQLPNNYHNLITSVNKYTNRLERIMRTNVETVNSVAKQYKREEEDDYKNPTRENIVEDEEENPLGFINDVDDEDD